MPEHVRARNSTPGPAPAVLVIDDDPAMLHSLASVFEAHGIDIATAHDGLAGLARFRQVSPKVVLTDIIMPELDGLSAIMEMRRQRPGVTIIAMSGGGRIGKSDFLAVAKQLGADSTVQKPFDVDELVTRIRRHLEPRR